MTDNTDYPIYEVVDNDLSSLLVTKNATDVAFDVLAVGEYDDLIKIAADLNELHDLKHKSEQAEAESPAPSAEGTDPVTFNIFSPDSSERIQEMVNRLVNRPQQPQQYAVAVEAVTARLRKLGLI